MSAAPPELIGFLLPSGRRVEGTEQATVQPLELDMFRGVWEDRLATALERGARDEAHDALTILDFIASPGPFSLVMLDRTLVMFIMDASSRRALLLGEPRAGLGALRHV